MNTTELALAVETDGVLLKGKNSSSTSQIIGYQEGLTPGHIEELASKIIDAGEIYFINYKNSSVGTGGVGTVTREMLKIFPDMRFIYHDNDEKQTPPTSYNVRLGRNREEALHTKFAKLYLWPVLHGLKSQLPEDEIVKLRPLVQSAYEQFAERTLIAASTRQKRPIYWVNDYTLPGVVRLLRKKSPASTIIFSWRTPFGNHTQPELLDIDKANIISSLLGADLVTFHRQKDLDNFLSSAREVSKALRNLVIDDISKDILHDGRRTRLRVVPMGTNRIYRKQLSHSSQSEDVKKQYTSLKKDCKLITGISRFEESKGIEYEIDCIRGLLEHHPEVKERFVFVRFSYLSKEKASTMYYNQFFTKVNSKIRSINEEFGNEEWQPIVNVLDKKLNDHEVTGVLRATDILLIGSHADGFNHLALEGILGRKKSDDPVQLILGNIGARDYLDGYLPVDTLSIKNGVNTLLSAINSTDKSIRERYNFLQKSANELSVENWILTILNASINIKDVPTWRMNSNA